MPTLAKNEYIEFEMRKQNRNKTNVWHRRTTQTRSVDAGMEEESMQGEPEQEEGPAMIVEPVQGRGRPPSMPRSLVWSAGPPAIVVSQLAAPESQTIGGDESLLSWIEGQAQ